MGGAAGHMKHPYEDGDLGLKDLLKMFDGIMNGSIDLFEKVDGYNLHVSMRGGTMVIARNKTTAINPIGINELTSMFKEDHVKKIFFDAATELEGAFWAAGIADLDGFLNLEILDSRTCRAFDYGKVIQGHWISHFDEKGNIERTEPCDELMSKLEGITFEIRGPNKLTVKLQDINEYDDYRSLFRNAIVQRHPFDIKSGMIKTVFADVRMQDFMHISDLCKELIVDRWLNKTANMKEIKTYMTPEQSKEFTRIDKHERYRIMRGARYLWEFHVCSYGAWILKNCVGSMSKTEMPELDAKLKQVTEYVIYSDSAQNQPEVTNMFFHLDYDQMCNFEGAVFQFKGKTYKLTGVYSIFNMLLDDLQRKRLAEETK